MIAYVVQFLPQVSVAVLSALAVALLIVGGATVLQESGAKSGSQRAGAFGIIAILGAAVPIIAVISIVFAVVTVKAVGYAGVARGVDVTIVNHQGGELFPVLVGAFSVPAFASILVAIGRSRALLTVLQIVVYSAIAIVFAAIVVSVGYGMPDQPDDFTSYPPFDVATVMFPTAGALMLTFVAWLSLARPAMAES